MGDFTFGFLAGALVATILCSTVHFWRVNKISKALRQENDD